MEFELGTLVEKITKAEKRVKENAAIKRESVMEEDLSYAKTSIGLNPNATEDKLVKVFGLPWVPHEHADPSMLQYIKYSAD